MSPSDWLLPVTIALGSVVSVAAILVGFARAAAAPALLPVRARYRRTPPR